MHLEPSGYGLTTPGSDAFYYRGALISTPEQVSVSMKFAQGGSGQGRALQRLKDCEIVVRYC